MTLEWDEEARFWTATSDEVPGLVLESAYRSALLERVHRAIPELLDTNQISVEILVVVVIGKEPYSFFLCKPSN